MNSLEKYNNIFMVAFDIEESSLTEQLEYNSIPAWDSVGHMSLIAQLEEDFSVTMDMDDIIEFSSYEKGKTILQKYEVVI